jgi:hypothetical protein
MREGRNCWGSCPVTGLDTVGFAVVIRWFLSKYLGYLCNGRTQVRTFYALEFENMLALERR